MTRKGMVARSGIALVVLSLLVLPVNAYADRGRGGGRDDHHVFRRSYPRHGTSAFFLAPSFFQLRVGGLTFYYGDGVFYRRSFPRYVVVAPPAGAVISAPPAGYQPVVVNGVMYYTWDGIYYRNTPSGYMVVPAPAGAIVVNTPAVGVTETVTVNVPNRWGGGYTPVVLNRSGSGFIGPQGEYYPDFPTVEHLRLLYGK